MSETNDATTGETDTPATRTRDEPGANKWLSGIASLIGLWIAVSPFVYETAATMLWNNVLVGAAIFLLAGYNYYRIVTDHPSSTGVLSLAALLGLWTVVSQFAIDGRFAVSGLDAAPEALVWSNVVSGILAAAIVSYVAYAARRRVRTGAPTGTQ